MSPPRNGHSLPSTGHGLPLHVAQHSGVSSRQIAAWPWPVQPRTNWHGAKLSTRKGSARSYRSMGGSGWRINRHRWHAAAIRSQRESRHVYKLNANKRGRLLWTLEGEEEDWFGLASLAISLSVCPSVRMCLSIEDLKITFFVCLHVNTNFRLTWDNWKADLKGKKKLTPNYTDLRRSVCVCLSLRVFIHLSYYRLSNINLHQETHVLDASINEVAVVYKNQVLSFDWASLVSFFRRHLHYISVMAQRAFVMRVSWTHDCSSCPLHLLCQSVSIQMISTIA